MSTFNTIFLKCKLKFPELRADAFKAENVVKAEYLDKVQYYKYEVKIAGN